MTGTAMTEAAEFWEIYKLDVVEIPTNRPNVRATRRRHLPHRREKYNAIVEEITDLWKKGQPVLVGTRSIEKSKSWRPCSREGRPAPGLERQVPRDGSADHRAGGRARHSTIATNMAGRGTDIVLGGNPPEPEERKWWQAGGLCMSWARKPRIPPHRQSAARPHRPPGRPGSSRFFSRSTTN